MARQSRQCQIKAAETNHVQQAFVYRDAFISVDEICSYLLFVCHHLPPSSRVWEATVGVDWQTDSAEHHRSAQCPDKEDFPEHLYVSVFGK